MNYGKYFSILHNKISDYKSLYRFELTQFIKFNRLKYQLEFFEFNKSQFRPFLLLFYFLSSYFLQLLFSWISQTNQINSNGFICQRAYIWMATCWFRANEPSKQLKLSIFGCNFGCGNVTQTFNLPVSCSMQFLRLRKMCNTSTKWISTFRCSHCTYITCSERCKLSLCLHCHSPPKTVGLFAQDADIAYIETDYVRSCKCQKCGNTKNRM